MTGGDEMIESIHFQGVDYTPEDFATFAAAHPEAFLPPPPPVPTLDQVKAGKLEDLEQACRASQEAGVQTSKGLKMRFGQEDIVLVDGVVRYAELKGLSVVPKLIEADGTIHADIPLADGQVIRLEQFEAGYQADEKLRALKTQVQAAETAEAVQAINW